MEIAKPTDADKAFFREVFEDHPELVVRPMFGNLAAFVASNDQMCAGLFGSAVGLRLGEADRAELSGEPGAGAFGPAERPMGEYVAIPPAWRTEPELLGGWIARAIAHTDSLPPKRKRAKK